MQSVNWLSKAAVRAIKEVGSLTGHLNAPGKPVQDL